MQIIYAGFNAGDSFEKIFAKYKDEVGFLFQDGNQILSNQDYKQLCKALSSAAQWNVRTGLHPYSNLDAFERNFKIQMPRDTKYFFRCFGIYLREATMRYGSDIANEGGFWESMSSGVSKDLDEAYFEQNASRRERNGFWENDGVQRELTGLLRDRGSLLEYVFSFFDNPYINTVENGSQKFVRHLVKMAICPLNYNPLRNHYAALLSNNQSIEAELNGVVKSTLDYHPGTRRLLTERIVRFFQFLPRIRSEKGKESVDKVVRNALARYFHIENPQHYFASWINEDFEVVERRPVGAQNRLRVSQGSVSRENYQIIVSYNVLSGVINVSAPSDLDLDLLFGNGLRLDPWGTYEICGRSDEVLLQIVDGQVLKGDKDTYNANVFKLFELSEVRIKDEYDEVFTVRNPWFLNGNPCFVFDRKGRRVESSIDAEINIELFVVLPAGEKIESITCRDGGLNSKLDELPIRESKNGLTFYRLIMNNPAIDEISIVVLAADERRKRVLQITVLDSTYLHSYADEDRRSRVRFLHQQRGKKIGIGSIELTHLPEGVNPHHLAEQLNDAWKNQVVNVGDNIGHTHASRLIVNNPVNEILSFKECEIDGGKIAPAIVLLPEGVSFWLAKTEQGCLKAFLKTESRIENLSARWVAEGGKYVYQVDDPKEWQNDGYPVEFAEGVATYFAKKPYFRSLIQLEEHMFFASEFFWGNNFFDDMIPENAFLYFRWQEANCNFEVSVPANCSVNKCLERFGLEGHYPDMEFGWVFEDTKFTVILYKDQNGGSPLQKPQTVYEMSDQERSSWLLNQAEKDVSSVKLLLRNYHRLFFKSELDDSEIDVNRIYEVNSREDALLLVGSKYLKEIADTRPDLTNLSKQKKINWLEKWIGVSDWEEMLGYLQKQLELRNDALVADLSVARKFNSPEEIESFVAERFIKNSYATLLNELLRKYGVSAYRYELPLNRMNVAANNAEGFAALFEQIVFDFKKNRFREEWNRICERECPMLIGYEFPLEGMGATSVVTWFENEARRMAAWCIPLMNQVEGLNWESMDLFAMSFLSETLNNFSIEDISVLSNKLANGINDCIRFAVRNNNEVSFDWIASYFNITEATFRGFTATRNNRFNFNEQRFSEKLLQEKNEQLVNRLRQELIVRMTECGKVDQLTQILKNNADLILEYVSHNPDNPTILSFLEYVSCLPGNTIFAAEGRRWRFGLQGKGLPKDSVPIPGECLLMDCPSYMPYMNSHPEVVRRN